MYYYLNFFFIISKIEKTNSIQSWSPNDYATAAGRSHNGKLPSAMDFMTRLNSDVSAIDFNSTSTSSSSTSSLVKIHKRERSPLSQSILPSTSSSDTAKKKKYKLVENSFVSKQTLSTTSLSSPLSSTSSLNSFVFMKSQLQSVDNKTAPEGRVEFLKVVSENKSESNKYFYNNLN